MNDEVVELAGERRSNSVHALGLSHVARDRRPLPAAAVPRGSALNTALKWSLRPLQVSKTVSRLKGVTRVPILPLRSMGKSLQMASVEGFAT